MTWLLGASLALASAPPEPGEPPALEELALEPLPIDASPESQEPAEVLAIGVNDQIIVWGEGAVRHARDAIISDFEDLGYRLGRTRRDLSLIHI